MTDDKNIYESKLDWSRLDVDHCGKYTYHSAIGLNNVYVPPECCSCNNTDCNLDDHRLSLGKLYDDICACLLNAGSCVIQNRDTRKSFRCKPGWNDYAKEVYDNARECFYVWKINGKPKQGPFFNMYKVAKAKCKYAQEGKIEILGVISH